jgi:glycosyltransferase involved in cell wall biosynthesis
MRVAVVHDWLTVYAGAERALEQILALYPEADLFSVIDFFPEHLRSRLLDKQAKTTFIQKLPFARKLYRYYLPLMPLAIEQLDMTGYDLVISSSHAVSKGILTGPDQLHICYCYSPIRYAWDLQHQYLEGKRKLFARYLLHKIRLWDARSANGVDSFACISHFIAKRIQKCYRRDAAVIYPPVSIDAFPLQEEKEDFYVTASRLVPYKKVDAIVEAFRLLPDRKLFVIGEGPEKKRIMKRAPKNVSFLGHVSHETLCHYMGHARAFLYAAVEDFGIAPLEAQACGTPVIAYQKGAVCETLEDTGIFFQQQTPSAIAEAVRDYEKRKPILPKACRENAKRFTIERFRQEFSDLVERMRNS